MIETLHVCAVFFILNIVSDTGANNLAYLVTKKKRNSDNDVSSLIHVNGEVDDAKVRRLIAIADEFRQLSYKSFPGPNYYYICSGNANFEGRLSTIDLLIKAACLVKQMSHIFTIKRS